MRAQFFALLAAASVALSSAALAQDSSRLSLDWPGTYQGTIPCGDCPGIQTRLTLWEDGTFERSTLYIDRDKTPFVDAGEFEWNSAGSVITLAGTSERPLQYQVGENRLFQLDRNGERITGGLAEQYQLVKIHTDRDLENRDWVLVELMGKPVPEDAPRPTITFASAESRVAGSDGCNRYFGSYSLSQGGRLELGQLAGTLMACPDMSLPEQYLSTLGRVGNYQVVDGELSLFKGRTAVMARFVLDPEA